MKLIMEDSQSGCPSACVICECVRYHKHLPARVIWPFSRQALCGFDHVAPRWWCFISARLWAQPAQIFNHRLTTRAEIETPTGPLAYLTSAVGSACCLCCAPQCIVGQKKQKHCQKHFWIVTVNKYFTGKRLYREYTAAICLCFDRLSCQLKISAGWK